jgi:hypothetical protein
MPDRSPRKVLVVTYFFPPLGGAGVQRMLKFVKYLPEHGFQPIVLTTRSQDYPAKDPSLLADVPNRTTINRARDPAVGKDRVRLSRPPTSSRALRLAGRGNGLDPSSDDLRAALRATPPTVRDTKQRPPVLGAPGGVAHGACDRAAMGGGFPR